MRQKTDRIESTPLTFGEKGFIYFPKISTYSRTLTLAKGHFHVYTPMQTISEMYNAGITNKRLVMYGTVCKLKQFSFSGFFIWTNDLLSVYCIDCYFT